MYDEWKGLMGNKEGLKWLGKMKRIRIRRINIL